MLQVSFNVVQFFFSKRFVLILCGFIAEEEAEENEDEGGDHICIMLYV